MGQEPFACPQTNPSPGWRHGQPCTRLDRHGPYDTHRDTFSGGADTWTPLRSGTPLPGTALPGSARSGSARPASR